MSFERSMGKVYDDLYAHSRQFTSIDPAPPSTVDTVAHSGLVRQKSATAEAPSVEELRTKLLDTSLPLFARYRAMFALRNIGSPAAIDALADGFNDDSDLFK